VKERGGESKKGRTDDRTGSSHLLQLGSEVVFVATKEVAIVDTVVLGGPLRRGGDENDAVLLRVAATAREGGDDAASLLVLLGSLFEEPDGEAGESAGGRKEGKGQRKKGKMRERDAYPSPYTTQTGYPSKPRLRLCCSIMRRSFSSSISHSRSQRRQVTIERKGESQQCREGREGRGTY
jgi:hypothetical protein